MATQITVLKLDEISLVDDPANIDARVEIVKRRSASNASDMIAKIGEFADALAGGTPVDPDTASAAVSYIQEITMDLETLSKQLDEAQKNLDTLTKRAEEAEGKIAKHAEEIIAKDTVIKAKDEEIAKLAADKPKPTDDEIMKSVPEPVRKRLEAAEAEITKMRDAADEAVFKAKAQSFGIGNADEIGPIMLRIAKHSTEDVLAIEKVLKAAGAQIKAAGLFKSVGSGSGAEDTSPDALLVQKTHEIQKADPKLTYAAAYTLATERNPELYTQYLQKRRVA